jgi:hypothetical protein
MKSVYPERAERARAGDETAERWRSLFVSLGGSLQVRVE